MRSITRTVFATLLLTAGSASLAMQSAAVDSLRHSGIEAPVAHVLATRQGSGMTLSEAVEQVRRQYNGRIVSAETIVSGGRETHVIKVLTDDGKVKTVRVPGRRL